MRGADGRAGALRVSHIWRDEVMDDRAKWNGGNRLNAEYTDPDLAAAESWQAKG